MKYYIRANFDLSTYIQVEAENENCAINKALDIAKNIKKLSDIQDKEETKDTVDTIIILRDMVDPWSLNEAEFGEN